MGLGLFKHWKNREDGTTAIEFALLAVPFVFTVISLIELAMYFTSYAMLENAVQDSARLIRTGQLQQGGGDALSEFLDEVCDQAGLFMNCADFQYQVEQLTDFNDSSTGLDDDGNLEGDGTFDIGNITAGCVGLVRVAYPYEFITPLFGSLWGSNGNVRTIVSTTVFRTEPYDLNVVDPNCIV